MQKDVDKMKKKVKKMKQYKFPTGRGYFFVNQNSQPYPETHCHDYWEFTIITKGSVLHKINNLSRRVEENTLLVIRPNDVHSIFKADDGEISHVNLGVKDEALKQILPFLAEGLYESLLGGEYLEYKLSKPTTIYFANMFNQFQTMGQYKEVGGQYQSIIFLSIIRELLLCVEGIRHGATYSPVINEFMTRLRKPENFGLSIEDIVKDMNYTHCHIIRLFKKETGMTPSQFSLKCKLNHARILLESTNMSIVEIASAVGFSSLGHFTEVFKNQYSLPPANYRRKWNNYYDSFEEVNTEE